MHQTTPLSELLLKAPPRVIESITVVDTFMKHCNSCQANIFPNSSAILYGTACGKIPREKKNDHPILRIAPIVTGQLTESHLGNIRIKLEFMKGHAVKVCAKTEVGRKSSHKKPCFRAIFQKNYGNFFTIEGQLW